MRGPEILFTGAVPLRPAAAVFEVLAQQCGDRVERLPDGEQSGWVYAAWEVLRGHPAVEAAEGALMTSADTPFGGMRSPRFVLRDGVSARNVHIDRFGFADTVRDSYRQLAELKRRGVVADHVRLQATIAGPGTTGGTLAELSWADVVAIVNPPLIADVEQITDAVPLGELAVQLDLAAEVEMAEWRRNPAGFDAPFLPQLDAYWGDWSLEQLVGANAEIADRVPTAAELGFHLCGLWHIDPAGGQDLRVHVDIANLLTRTVGRRIDYLHLPILPEHGPDDYAQLANLRLAPETKLFLGLIHRTDGMDGARRRIELASSIVEDFGVAHFCGLSELNQVGAERLDEVLEIHGQLARL